MIINLETKKIMSNDQFPNSNWMGEGWITVPRNLQEKATEFSPYCDLVLDEDDKGNQYLIDIEDNGTRPDIPNSEKRRIAYETMRYKEDGTPLAEWEGDAKTVNELADLWKYYSARGETDTANQIVVLDQSATNYIRELFQD